jgi:GDPmannose 4,6-dehydratase
MAALRELVRYYRPAEVDALKGDAAKARRKLGWAPKVTFPEMLRIMVEHDMQLAREELTLRQTYDREPRTRGHSFV